VKIREEKTTRDFKQAPIGTTAQFLLGREMDAVQDFESIFELLNFDVSALF
jgi:hypothetical protein